MGTTPLGFTYPSATDPPDGPGQMQQLAEDIDAYLAAYGDWADYTPTLTATATPPTLGSGSSITGRYTRIGDTVIGRFRAAFGSSGVAAGSGNYLLKLPTPAKLLSTTTPIGLAQITDTSASVLGFFPLFLVTDGDDKAFIRYQAAWPTGALVSVNHNTPWAWAASDTISATFCYEAS